MDLNRTLIGWLQQQPTGALFRWYGDGLSWDHPWSARWEDVVCDEIQEAVPCGWLWTVVQPWDHQWGQDGPVDPSTFWWRPDLVEYGVVEPDSRFWTDGRLGPEIVEITCQLGMYPTPVQIEYLQVALNEGSPERYVRGAGAWSAVSISRGLEWWVATYAGRGDLRFDWDPNGGPSPMLREVLRRVSDDDPG